MCVGVLPVCVLRTRCMPGSYRSQKRMLDPLEPDFQMVVSHHVGASVLNPSRLSRPPVVTFQFNFKAYLKPIGKQQLIVLYLKMLLIFKFSNLFFFFFGHG